MASFYKRVWLLRARHNSEMPTGAFTLEELRASPDEWAAILRARNIERSRVPKLVLKERRRQRVAISVKNQKARKKQSEEETAREISLLRKEKALLEARLKYALAELATAKEKLIIQ